MNTWGARDALVGATHLAHPHRRPWQRLLQEDAPSLPGHPVSSGPVPWTLSDGLINLEGRFTEGAGAGNVLEGVWEVGVTRGPVTELLGQLGVSVVCTSAYTCACMCETQPKGSPSPTRVLRLGFPPL